MQPATHRRGTSPIRWACAVAALLLWGGASPVVAADRGADGSFTKRTSSHFVLYQDVDIDETGGLRGSRRFEQQVLDELERAYDQLDATLGLRPPRRIDVVIYDPRVFDARFGGRFRFQAAGFFNGSIHIRGATLLTDPLSRVLHHELVHAAFHAAAPSLVLPAWLNEGAAEWFEARTRGKRRLWPQELGVLERAARGGWLLSLDALSAPNFAGLGPDAAGLAYLQSYAMIEYLVRHHGERSLRDLCDRLVRSHDLERSLRRTHRMGVLDLASRLRADLS